MCNAWNHPPRCRCGFGGEGHLGRRTSGNIYSGYTSSPSSSWSGESTSSNSAVQLRYSGPNALCPVCGAPVYFCKWEDGGKVFFDSLGWPWPKHPCTSQSRRLSESDASKVRQFIRDEAIAISSRDLQEAFPDEFQRYLEQKAYEDRLEQQRIEKERRLEQKRHEERIRQRIEEADQAYESRQWGRASALFAQLLSEMPKGHPLRRFAKYARADCLTHLGNRVEAEGLVDQERVDSWRAGVARASAYIYLGSLDQAATDLLAALNEIPDGTHRKDIILEALAYVRLLLALHGTRVEILRQSITSLPRK